jgi:hypothetical protein
MCLGSLLPSGSARTRGTYVGGDVRRVLAYALERGALVAAGMKDVNKLQFGKQRRRPSGPLCRAACGPRPKDLNSHI